MPTYRMTLPLHRAVPHMIPRRDLGLRSGDALVLRLALVEEDAPDAAALEMVGLGPLVRLRVWRSRDLTVPFRDYGTPILDRADTLAIVEGVADVATQGAVDITVPPETTSGWAGRYRWAVQILYGADAATLCAGVLQVAGIGWAAPILDNLTTEYLDPITDEDGTYIEV